ncbi:hypothetical protein BDP27DRAFT_1421426 [Rhodocollybia butyracea]|uniref:TEA domain-containing protein n=1 Tax=Rhodocollybia butyracea TaxID=206335 RepID=A0A9P5U6M4_9AGAR|nr:hypothetical protein BDP27DRAFT_1421426 [Rhodocollybia butyracea]
MSPHSDAGTSSTPKPHVGFIAMSTVEDLSYTPSAEEKTRDAAQIVATGRRSWKTLKGRGEAVWPPHLEAALIEALEKYKPDDLRSNKTLGRFSMRNRFISDFIYETTGKRRTPKQVGSRLQQLRDTCKSDRIMHLISRRNTENEQESSGSSSSKSPSVSPAPEIHTASHDLKKVVWVNIVLEQLSWPSPPPVINIVDTEELMPLSVHLAPNSRMDAISSAYGSVLSKLEPVVTLASPYTMDLYCSFSVFADGTGLPIHNESSMLTLHSTTHGSGNIYSASLVPGLWKSLCDSTTPTRFTIMQTLYLALESSGNTQDNMHISVAYNFICPESNNEFLDAEYKPNNFSPPRDPMPARPWNTDVMRTSDVGWNSQASATILYHSGFTTRSDVPSISQDDRGLMCSGDSWPIDGQRYTPQTLGSLPYC